MIAKRVIFHGRVQGVGFRYAVFELAQGFEVRGQVKNLRDGSVELLAIGEAHEVHDFIEEISTESNVAHHIHHFDEEALTEFPEISGFQIAR